jgi:hypothetical protein
MSLFLESKNTPENMKGYVQEAIKNIPTGMPIGGESLPDSLYTQEDKRRAELIKKTKTYLHRINGDTTMMESVASTLEEREELRGLLQEKVDSLNKFIENLRGVNSSEKERAHKIDEEKAEKERLAELSKVEKSLGI